MRVVRSDSGAAGGIRLFCRVVGVSALEIGSADGTADIVEAGADSEDIFDVAPALRRGWSRDICAIGSRQHVGPGWPTFSCVVRRSLEKFSA